MAKGICPNSINVHPNKGGMKSYYVPDMSSYGGCVPYFYLCMFDGMYLFGAIKIQCPPGNIFNPRLQHCDMLPPPPTDCLPMVTKGSDQTDKSDELEINGDTSNPPETYNEAETALETVLETVLEAVVDEANEDVPFIDADKGQIGAFNLGPVDDEAETVVDQVVAEEAATQTDGKDVKENKQDQVDFAAPDVAIVDADKGNPVPIDTFILNGDTTTAGPLTTYFSDITDAKKRR